MHSGDAKNASPNGALPSKRHGFPERTRLRGLPGMSQMKTDRPFLRIGPVSDCIRPEG